ncbi:lethal(2)neighbour of Tid protein-like [Penaeus japonicus]|uniref:lethal(2)neighbour of Tid protein-like n=1 Tax=Penaeus japonicus TaxID=27405 RepID=UPI001C7156A1|nr:lethal(2)neighbour of Tid protein-like [Penaeus japonicus]XP_042883515.1 lethal(2)neighbour of Tid protein-like [Penaeus japonicus]XP_042883516.1 lethal(2)neighbour of Tid protein-like [Penaeus japonicus]XP_042883517.1 lethal(2)neighbour of Tid protein-like [Penaeus japonicus]XP_042883518.1 lethal(2)neighbour of Tid protein-like [Penaeus japonicus]
MAPGERSQKRKSQSFMARASQIWQKYATKNMLINLIFNPKYLWVSALLFIVAEIVVNIYIIQKIKYTEIDWVAYMQEVEGVVNGTWDYTKLRGDTGPLVYPAGFVYIFLGLYKITSNGANVRLAQYIFAAFYVITLVLVFRIFHKSRKLPPYILIFLCCTSYRVHSIFVLRLFNDPVAMMFVYAAINLFIDGYWSVGSLIYSLAVSIKMNILLFAPALLLAYLRCLGLKKTILQLTICASVQLLLGLPFLMANPLGYIKQSFDLGRVFLFEWTVNWRFLPEEIFVNRWFHLVLLVLHLVLLCTFAYTHWDRYLVNYSTLQGIGLETEMACQLFVLPLFVSNFIGVAMSRSLHYQFYVWYFHSLPYLLWSTQFSVTFRLLLLGVVELCWNTYPSTWWSSGLLHACHLAVLIGLFLNRPTDKRTERLRKALDKRE